MTLISLAHLVFGIIASFSGAAAIFSFFAADRSRSSYATRRGWLTAFGLFLGFCVLGFCGVCGVFD